MYIRNAYNYYSTYLDTAIAMPIFGKIIYPELHDIGRSESG
jgi:hypothetical protein